MNSWFINISLGILFLSPIQQASTAQSLFSLRPSIIRPDGNFALTAEGAPDGLIALESSTNLQTWNHERMLAVEGGNVVFTDLETAHSSRKFYRATRVIRVSGTVREVETDAPVPHAMVELTLLNGSQMLASTQADEIGGFELYAVPPLPTSWFELHVSAAGFAPLTYEDGYHYERLDFAGLNVYLRALRCTGRAITPIRAKAATP